MMLKGGRLPKKLKISKGRKLRSKNWQRKIVLNNMKKNRRGTLKKVRGERLRHRRE